MTEKYSNYAEIKSAITAARDEGYKAFNDRIANCDYATVGVRIPVLKRIAKCADLSCRDRILADFFADEEKTFETVLVAGLIASRKGDYGATREYLRRVIPLFGSWAHPDCIMPWLGWVDPDEFLADFAYLLDCDGQYEVRTYIIYMFDCLTDDKIDFVLETLGKVRYGAYYVDMGAAWLLAECLVKFYDKTLPIFTRGVLPPFVHNKAIQKARESYRVPSETKEYLNTLKRKSEKVNKR
ncbi:MAG: hypothetical protein OSJ83_02475 [Clostridia bacterium]|nr:hypothetical protein [Clostridia bacterium]